MDKRRSNTDEGRRYTGVPSRQHAELAAFEREYTIERVTQRDLMLDLGAVLWFMTFAAVLLAGRLTDQNISEFQSVLRVVMAVISAGVGVLLLTAIRRLDDQRTAQVIAGLSVLALAIQFALSFYGPGSLGGFIVALVAIAVYVAQFLSVRGVAAMMGLVSVLAGVVVHFNYGTDYAPYLLSQLSLLVIVLWAVAYSIYVLKEDRDRALEAAERAAFADTLTGLPNTRMIRRRADALLDARNERINRRTGIVVLDLDGFRAANMLRGHRDGDRLLVAVANAMRDAAAPDQLVARTGSDEFSVLVPDATEQELAELGPRFRDAVLSALDGLLDRGVNIDASVGVALSSAELNDFDALMRTADRSVYLEKAAHERGAGSHRIEPRGEREAQSDRMRAPARKAPARAGAPSRWEKLRWSHRDMQARFLAIAWSLSGLAVAISMQMPDAVEHNSTIVAGLVSFAMVMAAAFYVLPSAKGVGRQVVDVLVASSTLAVTIWFTGKNSSPSVPIVLLILIYIGWFLPLRSVVPLSILALVIILTPVLFGPQGEFLIMDAVTIYGGLVVSAALLIVLYFNHYYIDRARLLTGQLAALDPRAGAYNRRAFDQRMDDELERLSYGDRDALAVVMVDLGNFKSVSANYGRSIGDQLLTEVAAALATASREDDCVARLGGDEFAVVSPGVDAESARALAQRLVSAVREALEESDLPSNDQVRPSAGFALYGMHGRTTDELVTAADIALTAAKTSGRDPNRVSSFVVSL